VAKKMNEDEDSVKEEYEVKEEEGEVKQEGDVRVRIFRDPKDGMRSPMMMTMRTNGSTSNITESSSLTPTFPRAIQ
jgi:hypothetical protein